MDWENLSLICWTNISAAPTQRNVWYNLDHGNAPFGLSFSVHKCCVPNLHKFLFWELLNRRLSQFLAASMTVGVVPTWMRSTSVRNWPFDCCQIPAVPRDQPTLSSKSLVVTQIVILWKRRIFDRNARITALEQVADVYLQALESPMSICVD